MIVIKFCVCTDLRWALLHDLVWDRRRQPSDYERSPHRPEHTAAALKMPDQAQSGLAETVYDVRPSEDPPSPACSDTHTLEHIHTKPEWEEESWDRKFHITRVVLNTKIILNQKQLLCDASQFILGMAYHIKYMGSEVFISVLQLTWFSKFTLQIYVLTIRSIKSMHGHCIWQVH